MAALWAKGSPAREFVKRRVEDVASIALGRLSLGTITHVETEDPVVALTFDDGPHPETTPRLLNLLAKAEARATFFVVGKSARAYPQVIDRMVAEGHSVANHSWDHSSLPLLTGRSRRRQIAWCEEVIPQPSSRLFRPPWGHQTWPSRYDALRAGVEVVAWSVMAEDWADEPPDRLVQRVEKGLDPGAIVLLHDALYCTDSEAARDRSATVDAVAEILRRHRDHYRFVTVPELLRSGRVRRWPWHKPSDLDWLKRQV